MSARKRHRGRPAKLALASASERRDRAKIIGVANAGPPARVGITVPDARHHTHVLAPTGAGKSEVILNLALQDAAAGRGLAVFDPAKGDLIPALLDRLPSECGDRLVLIDPTDAAALPALNLVDPANNGSSPHHTAARMTAVMQRVWHRWWGHRIADIAYHGLLTLAHIPTATLADLPRLLSDARWRAIRLAGVRRRLDRQQAGALTEFWDSFDAFPAGQAAPLLARLRLVLAHPLATKLFGVAATTFQMSDILDGGILLVRLPKGDLGEDGTRLIGSLLLAGLWQASTARARVQEHRRLDAAIYLDEAHNLLHLPIGIDDALAEARGLRVSYTLAHQYLGQLSKSMYDAVNANARNKLYFALDPNDAADQGRHVQPWLDEHDLTRLGRYETVLRPASDGRPLPPATLDTVKAPPPKPGRARALRRAARERTALDPGDGPRR